MSPLDRLENVVRNNHPGPEPALTFAPRTIDSGSRIKAVSRRRFLERTTAAAIATSALSALTVGPEPLAAQTKLTPDEALKELTDGNRRFTSGSMTSFEHDLAILKQHTAEKQEPFAAVLSCADSRVPVELVFDQTIGHVFVARVAGNVDDEVAVADGRGVLRSGVAA